MVALKDSPQSMKDKKCNVSGYIMWFHDVESKVPPKMKYHRIISGKGRLILKQDIYKSYPIRLPKTRDDRKRSYATVQIVNDSSHDFMIVT